MKNTQSNKISELFEGKNSTMYKTFINISNFKQSKGSPGKIINCDTCKKEFKSYGTGKKHYCQNACLPSVIKTKNNKYEKNNNR